MIVHAIGKPAGAKLIRLSAVIENGILSSISIRGDFFAIPEEGFERVESRLAGTPRIAAAELDAFAARFDQLLAEEGVEPYGISGAAVAEVLGTALKESPGSAADQGEGKR